VLAIGVRVEPALEQGLERLAHSMGKSRRAFVREAIAQSLQRFGDDDEVRCQSAVIAESCNTANRREHVPDWEDWA